MKRPASRKTGEILGGRYRIDSYLGAGGMGEVYAATQLVTGTRSALKLLFPEDIADPEACRRFSREALLASSIEHPNVIKVHDVFEDTDGTPVMVMELLQGETLASRLQRVHTLSLAEAAPIFRAVASALCAAHGRGVVHRDLKPDNIFLLEGAVAKVLDFGIAKSLEPELLNLQTYGSSTREGAILGSFEYMAPEQARLRKKDTPIQPATDAWAFAVVFVEALSGRRPLQRDSMPEMFEALLNAQRVPRVRSLLPQLPAALASALDQCLVKEPGQRARDLQAVLRYLGELEGAGASPRRRVAVFALSATAASALGLAAWGFWPTEAESRPLAVVPQPAAAAPSSPPPVAANPVAESGEPVQPQAAEMPAPPPASALQQHSQKAKPSKRPGKASAAKHDAPINIDKPDDPAPVVGRFVDRW